jgi:hypothetical protein
MINDKLKTEAVPSGQDFKKIKVPSFIIYNYSMLCEDGLMG